LAFVGGKIVRIIPDQPGRGGSKSSLSTQSINLDIRTAQNVFVYYGRWRRAPEAISAAGYQIVPNVTRSIGLHNYAAFDNTNANTPPVNKLLSHNLMNDGSHQITQHNTLTTIKTYTPSGADAAVPATFLNIKNRCFMCWAATNNFIYDSVAVREYDVGVDAPATAATYTFGDTDSGLAAAAAGSSRVNWVTSTLSGFENTDRAILMGGILYQTLQPNPLVTTFAAPGTASGTATSNTLTIVGGLWPLPMDYIGMLVQIDPLNIGGGTEIHYINSYTHVGADTVVTLDTPLNFNHTTDGYTLDGIGNSQLILATPYLGDTTTNTPFTVFSGPLTWGTSPPQYAYAYYDDPATNAVNGFGTGHISNVSPITYVTEQNQDGVSVVLDNIIPSGASDQPRFNKIQIFRTILTGGGGTLFPFDPAVGLIDNTGVLPLTFTDSYDDSYLLTTAGFQAPLTLNRKPPPFAHQAYWDGRVWGNPVNDPSAVVFSGDIIDILYGVPEECYPSSNILRIPSDDGRITGMKLVGPMLVMTTERYAYFVAGASPQYRLLRFSTMMYGVADYQMTEFVGQTTDDSDSLLYLGKDKKVYISAPTLGNISMSDPVQDVFSADITTGYANTRIADVAIEGNHYIVCTLEDKTEIYDFERKIWTDHIVTVKDVGAVRPEAFAKVYGVTVPVKFLFIHAGHVYDWLGTNNTTGVLQATVATNPIMIESKKRRRMDFVRIYVSDNSNPWGVVTAVNEGGAYQWAATPQSDPLYALQGAFPLDSINAKELIVVQFTQDQPVVDGYRFQVTINWPGDNVIRDLYAIDICFTDLEEDGQTSI